MIPLCAFMQNPGPSITGANASNISLPLVRASNITSSSSAISLTAYPPAAAQVGDFCVAVFNGQNNGLNTPSGWTRVQYNAQGYWNGAFYYKTLTSEDISSGITITTDGDASSMIIAIIDFNGSTGGYVDSASRQDTNSQSSSTNPSITGSYGSDTVIFVAGYRGDTVPTIGNLQVSGMTLLQNVSTGNSGATSIYAVALPSSFASTTVTYSFPGTYHPVGWYAGWLAVTP